MSAFQPPNQINGIYNPIQYANPLTDVAHINQSNTFSESQYCSATPPASSTNNTQLATTAFVQSAISGSAVIPPMSGLITLTSTASSNQTWTFEQTGFLSAYYYTFTLYSPNLMFGSGSSTTASGGTVSTVTGNIYATGMCSITVFINSYNGTYNDNGEDVPYTWSQIEQGWMPKIVSSQGATISTATLTFGSTPNNTSTQPPTAGTYTGSHMTFTLSAPLGGASEYLFCTLTPANE